MDILKSITASHLSVCGILSVLFKGIVMADRGMVKYRRGKGQDPVSSYCG